MLLKSETLLVNSNRKFIKVFLGRKDVVTIPMEPGCKVYKIDDANKKDNLWI